MVPRPDKYLGLELSAVVLEVEDIETLVEVKEKSDLRKAHGMGYFPVAGHSSLKLSRDSA